MARRILQPRGEVVEVLIDLRDGQQHLAHMTFRDCPLTAFHAEMSAQYDGLCNYCNGTGYFLRFEKIRSLEDVPESSEESKA
jgi:hypothetical protein